MSDDELRKKRIAAGERELAWLFSTEKEGKVTDELSALLNRHEELFKAIHERMKQDLAELHDCYISGFNDGYDKALEDIKNNRVVRREK